MLRYLTNQWHLMPPLKRKSTTEEKIPRKIMTLSIHFPQERRRLKERFPTLVMEISDKDECTSALNSYKQLLMNKDICEGNCVRGQSCPTGAMRNSHIILDHHIYSHSIEAKAIFISIH